MPVTIVPATFTSPEDIYLYRGANILIQDASEPPVNNPDPTTGFYWGFKTSGTPAPPPVYSLGCITGLSIRPQIEEHDIECDNVGTVFSVTRLKSLVITANVFSLLPLKHTAIVLDQAQSGVVIDTTNNAEFLGLGVLANNLWHVLLYNEGAKLGLWLHKCSIRPDTLSIGANESQISINITALAATEYPSAQQFGVIVRNLS